jgi:hypothetical protein
MLYIEYTQRNEDKTEHSVLMKHKNKFKGEIIAKMTHANTNSIKSDKEDNWN